MKWYPTEDEKKFKRRVKTKSTTPQKNLIKLKKSLVPGRVLILLAGRFEGRRVVFLKQLDSGLLLVTGPYQVNGVPLRRVNQAYTISTSEKIDISGLDIPSNLDDSFFVAKKVKQSTREAEFFAQGSVLKLDPEITKARKATQEKVDSQLIGKVSEVAFMKEYLRDRFFLRKGDAPHHMKF